MRLVRDAALSAAARPAAMEKNTRGFRTCGHPQKMTLWAMSNPLQAMETHVCSWKVNQARTTK